MQLANRIQQLSTNVFADMDRAKTTAKSLGKTLIDLSLGSSDLPTDSSIIKTIETSLHDPETHGYLLYRGTEKFRKVASQFYTKNYQIPIDADTEILPLIGCQEGTAHLPLAILNEGDYALLQNPGYPSHMGGVHLAGGKIYPMPLLAENNFLPVFEDIPLDILAHSKMMILSYPHNPTTAVAPLAFLQKAVKFCQDHHLVLVHDFPYADIYFEGTEKPHSILEADPEKTVSVELFTFSKSYNMGGFRIGYIVGNATIIKALRQIKSVVDFNQYQGILNGAIQALENDPSLVRETVNIFAQRRDILISELGKIGWNIPTPPATLYLWAKLPPSWKKKSIDFCVQLVTETGVALSPGSGFGSLGEGYVRFALVRDPIVLREAVAKIALFLQQNT